MPHRRAIAAHPQVDALRFNTISPLATSRRETLEHLRELCGDKPLWIDLKGRQLRIAKFAYLPYAYVTLSHRISVTTPCDVYFRDCISRCVEVVDGNQLILDRRPVRVVGEGEPINILDESLVVEGTLTDGDREYIEAARALGMHDYMLSFVESRADLDEVRMIDPDANLIAKIESRRGLRALPLGVRTMAARDDLFVQLGARIEDYVPALEEIIEHDPEAIAASRILESLETSSLVSAGDVADLALLARLGYRTIMLSDTLCFREEAFRTAMDVLARLA